MKWTYSIPQKLKIALALLTVFLTVFATNMINRRHFADLQESFTSIYEDRLVAENYLFDLSRYLQLKRQRMERIEGEYERQVDAYKSINDSIHTTISKYEATKLTKSEQAHFTSLKKRLGELDKWEQSLLAVSDTSRKYSIIDKINIQYQLIWTDLIALSRIQMAEGKRLVSDFQHVIAGSNLTSQLEIGILIVIGLIVQALIFSSKSIVPKFKQPGNLN